jgi:hypothetical protein
MVANAGNLIKIQDQGMNCVGIGVVKVKLEAMLLLPLKETVILPHQLAHVSSLVPRPGGVEGPEDGTAR